MLITTKINTQMPKANIKCRLKSFSDKTKETQPQETDITKGLSHLPKPSYISFPIDHFESVYF